MPPPHAVRPIPIMVIVEAAIALTDSALQPRRAALWLVLLWAAQSPAQLPATTRATLPAAKTCARLPVAARRAHIPAAIKIVSAPLRKAGLPAAIPWLPPSAHCTAVFTVQIRQVVRIPLPPALQVPMPALEIPTV